MLHIYSIVKEVYFNFCYVLSHGAVSYEVQEGGRRSIRCSQKAQRGNSGVKTKDLISPVVRGASLVGCARRVAQELGNQCIQYQHWRNLGWC